MRERERGVEVYKKPKEREKVEGLGLGLGLGNWVTQFWLGVSHEFRVRSSRKGKWDPLLGPLKCLKSLFSSLPLPCFERHVCYNIFLARLGVSQWHYVTVSSQWMLATLDEDRFSCVGSFLYADVADYRWACFAASNTYLSVCVCKCILDFICWYRCLLSNNIFNFLYKIKSIFNFLYKTKSNCTQIFKSKLQLTHMCLTKIYIAYLWSKM